MGVRSGQDSDQAPYGCCFGQDSGHKKIRDGDDGNTGRRVSRHGLEWEQSRITPAPDTLTFPPLLVNEAVHVRVYPLETVVAEKFVALCELGLVTTRMKDIYDLWVILRREDLDLVTLKQAVSRSFGHRGTPPAAEVLSEDFAADPERQRKWSQYLRRTGLEAPRDFRAVMDELRPDLIAVAPTTS